jgi:hypothetical protein
VTGALIGAQTTAGGFDIGTYRATLPAAAIPSGVNGAYILSGFPAAATGSPLPPFSPGAQVVIVYANPSSLSTAIAINDGLILIGGPGVPEPASASVTLGGLAFSGAVASARTTFILGGAETDSVDSASFNNAAVGGANPFRATSGQWWDSLSLDVTALAAPNPTSATAGVTNAGPVYLFCAAQVYAVAASPATATPAPTPAPAPSLAFSGAATPGTSAAFTGAGFAGGERVTCFASGSAFAGGVFPPEIPLTAGPSGTFSGAVAVPATAAAGSVVSLSCTGATSGATASASTAVVVTPPPPIPEANVLALFGSGLAGLGSYAAFRLRRLRR